VSADADDLSERLYQAADAVRDGAPVPPELAAFFGGLQGGGQLNPDGTPAASSVVQPEATPYPAPEAAGSFSELLRQVPDVQRAIASGDDQTAQDAAVALAQAFNATADQHAREQSRERFPQAARSDEDLAQGAGRRDRAATRRGRGQAGRAAPPGSTDRRAARAAARGGPRRPATSRKVMAMQKVNDPTSASYLVPEVAPGRDLWDEADNNPASRPMDAGGYGPMVARLADQVGYGFTESQPHRDPSAPVAPGGAPDSWWDQGLHTSA